MTKHPILIVDDDALIISTLKKRFEGKDMEIFTSTDPASAKAILDKVVPEVLILDLLLTKEGGSSGIIDYMKSKEALKDVPILVLTNLDKPELKEIIMSRGVKEYLIKGSMNLDQLYEKVLGYLEPKRI